MDGFGPSTYGDGFAEVYDDWYGSITDADATARFCASRVQPGAILELGVGSGRLVAAFTTEGMQMIGVDASGAMLQQAQKRHPVLPLVQADLEHLPLGNRIGGAICAFNTLFNLPSAVAQQRFLQTIANTLVPEAPLVIEAMTGMALADGPSTSVGVSKLTTDRLVLSATVVDHDAQTIQGQHVDFTENGTKLRPWLLRWTTPDQLDALAANAGLTLVERFGGWLGEPFDQDSENHVSVYQRVVS